jgi:hypothetical protein
VSRLLLRFFRDPLLEAPKRGLPRALWGCDGFLRASSPKRATFRFAN